MDTESSVLNHPFDLFPVYIPGWKTPVLPEGLAHGGIPQSIYDGRPQGLQCVIYAWTELKSGSWTMAVLDRVDLYVNGELSGAGFTVQPGEENKEYFLLDLPQGKLREGVNRLHYTITRLSENPGISDDLNVLYHLRAPGEPAPQGLDLVIPPDVLLDGVSAEQAAQGVTFGFTYSNPRDYDSIRFLVGNVTVPVDGFDASRPVTHTLFTDTFRQAGDNPNTALQFTVTDQLGNANRSSIKHLDIHLDRVLIAPTLTHVKDSAGQEIPDKGETTSTTLELSGEASKGKEIEVYDGSGASAVPKGKALADATTGLWTREISVSVGARRLYAKSLYHPTNVYSNVRTLTVMPEPLSIDTRDAILDQLMFRADKFPDRPPVGAFVERIPSGGVPPYIYTSSDPEVAELFSSSEPRVVSKHSGTATITVRDQMGASVSYRVITSKVWLLFDLGKDNEWQKYWTCWGAAWNAGGTIPDLVTWGALRTIHDGDPGLGDSRAWASDQGPGDRTVYTINPKTGVRELLSQDSDYARGWMIKEV
ncbi:hypothetical protein ACNT2N_27135 [Pseudomonas thivervalensis]|uniref:Uncharacterized protein n=1 Tax=Pseudomonas thivervalensis TaxID=86265 RepID=A0A2Z4ZWT7_9PSED|nr:hypothetical protein [Pseudomonas thivervalensis]AXA56771.1 hypothetical protein CE140_21190 [Pseudomonas thivervalensis]AXA62584.1 hypothetical protein CEQ51_21740 [Pseudomonas thivervalensis]